MQQAKLAEDVLKWGRGAKTEGGGAKSGGGSAKSEGGSAKVLEGIENPFYNPIQNLCLFWRCKVKCANMVEGLWSLCYSSKHLGSLHKAAGISKWKDFLGTFHICFSSASFGDPSMHYHSMGWAKNRTITGCSSTIPGMPSDIPGGFSMPSKHVQACMPLWDWIFPQPKIKSIIGCCSGIPPRFSGCGIPSMFPIPSDTF